MTWPGTSGSGAGIGTGHLMPVGLIHVALRQARSAWFGAAVGTAARATAGRRTAAAATRPTGATTSGSVPSCPQVSHEQAEQSGRSEGRTKPDCEYI